MSTAIITQIGFYREFLMAREFAEPRDHGVNLSREDFTDLMVDEFGKAYKGQMSVDEMLLHPRLALQFCDDVRAAHRFFDLPDDLILRAIMKRRKNPND